VLLRRIISSASHALVLQGGNGRAGWALGTEALSATWLYLDDQKMLVNAEANHYKQVELDLFPGWYDITLRFLDAGDHSHVYL